MKRLVGGIQMSDHYYSKSPQSNKVTQAWEFTLRDNLFTFTSSTGVFSKRTVDFGTQLLVEAFVEPGVSGELLDLGCGYGPIGLALARELPKRKVVMVDVNDRAVSLAQKNAQKNAVTNVEIKQSDGFQNVSGDSFSAVITNPPIRAGKELIYSFFKESVDRLTVGGELWIVIQKKQGAPSTLKYLSTIFGEVDIVDREKGYFIIRAKKTE